MPEIVYVPKPDRPLTDEERRNNEAAIAFLEDLANGDEQEQRETWEVLRKALGPERASYRRLF